MPRREGARRPPVPCTATAVTTAQPKARLFDATRPIFQATIPPAPPTEEANYSALSVVINVDLAPNVDSAAISSDQDLFIRDADEGTIEATSLVTRAELTTTTLLLPIQLSDGAP